MIRLIDALQLAQTKLRTRRIRLFVTVFVSSLLFAALVFLALVIEGSINALQSFNKEGLGDRVLVQASPVTTYGFDDAELIKSLQPEQKKLIEEKKAAAKKLGLEYDEKTDPDLPLMEMTGMNGGTDKTVTLSYSSKRANKAVDEKQRKVAGLSFAAFQDRAKEAGAQATYRSARLQNMGDTSTSGSYSVLVDGKEELGGDTKYGVGFNPQTPKGVQTIVTDGWQTIDGELMKPFLLPGQSVAPGSDGSVPVIAPVSAAEQVVGLKEMPATATTQQKLDRLVELRSSVAGKTAQICYRNAASAQLVNSAVTQKQEIESNKNNKEYVKPSLIYALPTTPCGAVTIASDKRTADEKKLADNQKKFDAQFGKETEPEQSLMTVRIVGVNPDVSYEPGFSASGIFSSLLRSSLGSGWFSPIAAVDANPVAVKIFGAKAVDMSLMVTNYYAEFSTVQAAKDFTEANNCTMDGGFGPNFNPNDAMKKCTDAGRYFYVYPYGNSAGAIEEIQQWVAKVGKYVLLAVVVVASIIMMGNVGKVIADSRRETAVFRALGAKRLDISQIYFTYTLFLCAIIFTCALVIGSIGAVVLNNAVSPSASVAAVLAYNAQDVTKQFTLIGYNPLYLLFIAATVITAGLISSLLPLLTNMRRNPIRDMRDEN